MGHHIQLEIERKYDVDDTVAPPNLVGIGAIAVMEPAVSAELIAVYYDTDRLDVTRARRALRRRSGGTDAGWHVKVAPADAPGRTEHHWPLEAAADDAAPGGRTPSGAPPVPEEIVRMLAEVTGGRPLHPVARVVNQRTTHGLTDAAGYPVAEFCDDRVAAVDLRDGARRRWREWEIELAAAAPDHPAVRSALWNGLERAVTAAGAHASSSSSKLARALGIDPMPAGTPQR